MHLQTYVLVADAYDAWKRGDLEAFGNYLAENIAFTVPFATSTFVGDGTGREELKRRLQAFLDDYEVCRFDLLTANPSRTQCVFRIEYVYRARETGLEIVGTQRHIWGVAGQLITSFTVAHDTQRLGAFFELTRPSRTCVTSSH
jgi:ketosteroid isomerase-like protein